jgi:hypothetical protein
MNTTGREDDDPGLHKPDDFKQKQVSTDPTDKIWNLCSTLAGIQGKDASVACLSINRSHLWRYRNQSSLRLLIDVQLATFASGSHRSAINNNLESVHNGDSEIRVCHSSRG